jgi:undecaprenyl-diphosphatase
MRKHGSSNRNALLTLILTIAIGIVLFGVLIASLGSVWLERIDGELLRLTAATAESTVRFFKVVTVLGSDYVAGVVMLLTLALLYRSAKISELFTAAAVGVAAKAVEYGCKFVIHRTRPALPGPGNDAFGDYSFPSGHSLNAAAIYGFVLVLIGTNVEHGLLKYLALVVGVSLILAVGVSRVVLNVHWPSDVVGGWLAGSVLWLIGWLVLLLVKGRV